MAPRAGCLTPLLRRSSQDRFMVYGLWFMVYGYTSLTRKRTPIGPYCRPMPRVLGGSSSGVGVFLWGRYPCTVYVVWNSAACCLNERVELLSCCGVEVARASRRLLRISNHQSSRKNQMLDFRFEDSLERTNGFRLFSEPFPQELRNRKSSIWSDREGRWNIRLEINLTISVLNGFRALRGRQ